MLWPLSICQGKSRIYLVLVLWLYERLSKRTDAGFGFNLLVCYRWWSQSHGTKTSSDVLESSITIHQNWSDCYDREIVWYCWKKRSGGLHQSKRDLSLFSTSLGYCTAVRRRLIWPIISAVKYSNEKCSIEYLGWKRFVLCYIWCCLNRNQL